MVKILRQTIEMEMLEMRSIHDGSCRFKAGRSGSSKGRRTHALANIGAPCPFLELSNTTNLRGHYFAEIVLSCMYPGVQNSIAIETVSCCRRLAREQRGDAEVGQRVSDRRRPFAAQRTGSRRESRIHSSRNYVLRADCSISLTLGKCILLTLRPVCRQRSQSWPAWTSRSGCPKD